MPCLQIKKMLKKDNLAMVCSWQSHKTWDIKKMNMAKAVRFCDCSTGHSLRLRDIEGGSTLKENY